MWGWWRQVGCDMWPVRKIGELGRLCRCFCGGSPGYQAPWSFHRGFRQPGIQQDWSTTLPPSRSSRELGQNWVSVKTSHETGSQAQEEKKPPSCTALPIWLEGAWGGWQGTARGRGHSILPTAPWAAEASHRQPLPTSGLPRKPFLSIIQRLLHE